MKYQKSERRAVLALLIAIVAAVCVAQAAAQSKKTYAGVGFMALSPVLTDAMNSFSIADTLYGGTVSFAVNSWFAVGADVLYLGDIYYENGTSGFSGPYSWTVLNERDPAVGAKADANFESMIYAPLTFNLTIPLGFLKPYIGAGPAFYFHFPSTNADPAFTAYLNSRYGDGERIRTGLTARAGLDIFLANSLAIGAGYIVREDVPAKVLDHLADKNFYFENGYAFLTAKMILR